MGCQRQKRVQDNQESKQLLQTRFMHHRHALSSNSHLQAHIPSPWQPLPASLTLPVASSPAAAAHTDDVIQSINQSVNQATSYEFLQWSK